MICKHILNITFLNKPEHLFCTDLNGFKYYYITATIQHQSFICSHILYYLCYIITE